LFEDYFNFILFNDKKASNTYVIRQLLNKSHIYPLIK